MPSETDSLIDFFELAGNLKKEKRQGWIIKGIAKEKAESVADHCFRLALMAMVFAKKLGLNEGKAVKMALVHDLPEAIVGDIAVRINEKDQKVSIAEKNRREKEALEKIIKPLDKGIAKEIAALWNEYEEKKSKEAVLVFELDRLEAIFQAREYEKSGEMKVDLQEFYDYANDRIKMPELREIFEKMLEKRGK